MELSKIYHAAETVCGLTFSLPQQVTVVKTRQGHTYLGFFQNNQLAEYTNKWCFRTFSKEDIEFEGEDIKEIALLEEGVLLFRITDLHTENFLYLSKRRETARVFPYVCSSS